MPIARAVRIKEPGGPEVLSLDRVSVAEPGPREVLVEVAAAGLNRADILQRRGFYPAPLGAPPDIPGLEIAGQVAKVGEAVTMWSPGDAVMGIVSGGGMCTHACLHERELLRVPKGMPLAQAAAIPEVFLTAYDALFLRAELRLGESLLVHAIASGVGTAALQLATRAGARVIGSSRSEDKLARLEARSAALGSFAPLLVDRGSPAFADRARELSGGEGVAVVLDMVGASYLRENLKSLAPRGRMVTIGLMGGREGEIPLGLLLRKRLSLYGSVLRSRPLEEKAALARAFSDRVLPLFESGALSPVVEEVLPMQEVAEAHRRMEQCENLGKLVLSWGG